MAKQYVLVRKLPPTGEHSWRMYARNLATGAVTTIPLPDPERFPDPFLAAIGALMGGGTWTDPSWAWDRDQMRRYTIEV